MGISHVLSRKNGKQEKCSLTLAYFLPAFCPLLIISILSEEPLGQTKLFSEVSIGTSEQQALVSKVSLVFQVYEGSGFLRVLLY